MIQQGKKILILQSVPGQVLATAFIAMTLNIDPGAVFKKIDRCQPRRLYALPMPPPCSHQVEFAFAFGAVYASQLRDWSWQTYQFKLMIYVAK